MSLKANNKIQGRVCFISASYLVHEYKAIDPKIIDESIFFFGSARHWIFPSNEQEKKESLEQPTAYLSFPQGFKDLILSKEKQGLVHFLKPSLDYALVSKFLEAIVDPVTTANYKPLILDDQWWLSQFKNGKYCTFAKSIISNYKEGEHGYRQVMELLYQSNPTLIPVLTWNNSGYY